MLQTGLAVKIFQWIGLYMSRKVMIVDILIMLENTSLQNMTLEKQLETNVIFRKWLTT